MSEKVLAAIRTISDKPIRHIINTSADEAHTGGNESLSNAGRNVNAGVGGQNGREPARLEGAPVIAHELVLHRMSGLKGEPRAHAVRRVAARHVLHEHEADLLRRRGRRDAARARRAHRRRRDRLVPQVGRRRHRRRVLDRHVPDDRSQSRRKHSRHPRRAQPASSTSPSPPSTTRAARSSSPATGGSATSPTWPSIAT